MAIKIQYETIIPDIAIGDNVTVIYKGVSKNYVVSNIIEQKITTGSGTSGNSTVTLTPV